MGNIVELLAACPRVAAKKEENGLKDIKRHLQFAFFCVSV
jgi:hypothetical protein